MIVSNQYRDYYCGDITENEVGKTVKITYKLSKTKKVIATRKIVVDKKATSIKASSIPVPTGYKMVSSGNCSVRTRKITIYVTK